MWENIPVHNDWALEDEEHTKLCADWEISHKKLQARSNVRLKAKGREEAEERGIRHLFT